MSLKFYVIGREQRRADSSATTPDVDRRTNTGRHSHYIGIHHGGVSRRHAELYVVDDRVFLRDLGSKNGTFLLEKGRKRRLTEGYVRPDQLVFFGTCLRRLSKLLESAEAVPPDDRSGTVENQYASRA